MYFLSKLSEINFRMAIHEKDAVQRLTSEAENIVVLTSENVPEEYKLEFEKLKSVLNATLDTLEFPLKPLKIKNIRNVTAAKYIKLLLSIEYSLLNKIEDKSQDC